MRNPNTKVFINVGHRLENARGTVTAGAGDVLLRLRSHDRQDRQLGDPNGEPWNKNPHDAKRHTRGLPKAACAPTCATQM